MTRKYARGKHAVAECQRSGQKMPYRDLVEDGHVPGLLVHPDWWEPKHPQETPVTIDDPIALWRPAPELSVPSGHGDAENPAGEAELPTQPAPGDSCNTVATAVNVGDTHVTVNEAVTYTIGQRVFIQRDDSSYFVSLITSTADSPTFRIPFTTPYSGGAVAVNNSVCWGEGFVMPAVQTFTLTIGEYGGTPERMGWTTYAGSVGSIVPDPPLVVAEDGKLHLFREVTNYEGPTNGFEVFFETGTLGSDPTAQILFTTFSRIEIDHAGGTEVLDTRDVGSGGDMLQSSSTEGGYADFWFPNAPKVWTSAHIGNQYQVRLYA